MPKRPRFIFQTKPMKHQRECFDRSCDLEYFALLMEQGTGKTKVAIDTAAYLFEAGRIDGLIALGPNEGDVPDNWLDQIELHLPKRIKRTALRLHADSKTRKWQRKILDHLLDPNALRGQLRVISTNIEAIRSGSPVFRHLLDFCRRFRVMIAIDESTRIKGNSSAQTKAALKLGMNATHRRIMTGTFSDNPLDAFAQTQFLKPGLLGFDSFTAFKAHYCQLLPPEHGLVRFTAEKMAARIHDPARKKAFVDKMKSIIQMPMRDPNGLPLFKNTQELHDRLARHSFRVLKDDCLDLPPKVYERRVVDLTPKQREIYDQVKNEVIAEFVHDGRITTMTMQLAITRLLRLQQVTCNHYSPDPDPDAPTKTPPQRIEPMEQTKKGLRILNPRIAAVKGIIEEMRPEAKAIIWCRHHPEITELREFLHAEYGYKQVVELHGKVTGDDRVASRKRFQDPKSGVRFCIGQVRSGIGIDLFAATVEIYYSNSYSLEERLQSEDRAHRKGQTKKVTIFDIEARDTLDSKIIATLKAKKEISDLIMGDNPKNWI